MGNQKSVYEANNKKFTGENIEPALLLGFSVLKISFVGGRNNSTQLRIVISYLDYGIFRNCMDLRGKSQVLVMFLPVFFCSLSRQYTLTNVFQY